MVARTHVIDEPFIHAGMLLNVPLMTNGHYKPAAVLYTRTVFKSETIDGNCTATQWNGSS
jgi:hypothetical protein